MKITLRKKDSVTSIILFLYNVTAEISGEKSMGAAQLINLTRYFGKTESAVRTCLSRMMAQHFLEIDDQSKDTRYRLSDAGFQSVQVWNRGLNRCLQRITERHQPWEGIWHFLSLREFNKSEYINQPVVDQLKEAGLREFSPGVWLAPYRPDQELIEEMMNKGIHAWEIQGTINPDSLSADWMEKLFNLSNLQRLYEVFLNEAAVAETNMADHKGLELLPTLFRLGWTYFDASIEDPWLPTAVLPDWVGDLAAQRMKELRPKLVAQISETIK